MGKNPIKGKPQAIQISFLTAMLSPKTHLKNIENTTGLLLEDIRSGRDNSTDEIRQEIRLLARTIAALAEGTE